MIGRLIHWIVRTAYNLSIWLVLFILGWVWRIVRRIGPWFFRRAWGVVRDVTLWLVASVISLFVGLPRSTSRMADHWHGQAITSGFPQTLEEPLHNSLRVIAFLVILAGWAVLAVGSFYILRIIIDQL